MNLDNYIEEKQKLYQLDNSQDCPDNISQLWNEFFDKYNDVFRNSFYKLQELTGKAFDIDLHDGMIQNFSQKKSISEYTVSFQTTALLYEPHKTQEVGWVKMDVSFKTPEKIRDVANGYIYEFIISDSHLCLATTGIHKHKYKVVPYRDLKMNITDLTLYQNKKMKP